MTSPKIPWMRLLAEGAVIMASVLLALAAEAWWQGGQARYEEAQLLAGLRAEALENQLRLTEELALVFRARDALRAIGADVGGTLPTLTVGEGITPIYRDFVIELNHGFQNATIDSGKLGLIRDPNLRAALEETGALSEVLDRFRGRLADLNQRGVLALGRYPEALEIYRNIPASLEGVIDPSLLRDLRADADLMAIVGAKTIIFTGYSRELGRLHDHLDQLVSLIDGVQNVR